jgi:hypothetical protein
MIVILALSIASADLQCELVVVDVENVIEPGLYDLKLGSGAGTRWGGAVTRMRYRTNILLLSGFQRVKAGIKSYFFCDDKIC